jgi:hypothetical protein
MQTFLLKKERIQKREMPQNKIESSPTKRKKKSKSKKKSTKLSKEENIGVIQTEEREKKEKEREKMCTSCGCKEDVEVRGSARFGNLITIPCGAGHFVCWQCFDSVVNFSKFYPDKAIYCSGCNKFFEIGDGE